MKKNEDKGISAKDMSEKELRVLAVSFKLFTEAEAKKLKKSALLKAIHAHEKAILEDPNRPGLKRASKSDETEDLGLYEGKKVISRTLITHNSKEYIDILVESGETYRELVK